MEIKCDLGLGKFHFLELLILTLWDSEVKSIEPSEHGVEKEIGDHSVILILAKLLMQQALIFPSVKWGKASTASLTGLF